MVKMSVSSKKKNILRTKTMESSLLDALPQAVLCLENRIITFANDAVEQVFGWKQEEIVNQSARVLCRTDEEFEKFRRDVYHALSRRQKTACIEFPFKKKNVGDIECRVILSKLDGDQKSKKVVAIFEDITEQKLASDLFSILASSSQIAFYVVQGHKFVYANPQGYKDTGLAREDEIIGKDSLSFIHPDDKELLREKSQTALKNKPLSPFEFRIINKDGRIRWVLGMYIPINYIGKDALLGYYVDITKLKRAESDLEHSREQLRSLTTHLQSVREEERNRIAYELHDEMGQILTTIKMDLLGIVKRLHPDQRMIIGKTQSISKLIDIVLNKVKSISMELRPGMMNHLGLTTSIEWQAKEFQRSTGIRCEVKIPEEDIFWDPKGSTALSYIFQEILNNVSRHANATRVEIELRKTGNKIELLVIDNGRGVTEEQIARPQSFGLIGMRERVRSLNGEIEISGKKDKGTKIRISVPIFHKDQQPIIRVVIADEHPIFRQGLKQIISDTKDMCVVEEIISIHNLLEEKNKSQGDILLLDLEMIGRGGLSILKDIKKAHPDLPVLVLSMYPEEQYAVRVMKAGASGYLTKESAPNELIMAIHKISIGKKYVSMSLAEKLANEVDIFSSKSSHEKLSDREYQVMLMLASGKTVGEIAEELFLSAKTISTHRSRILEKMGIKNNAQLTRYAIDHQLLI